MILESCSWTLTSSVRRGIKMELAPQRRFSISSCQISSNKKKRGNAAKSYLTGLLLLIDQFDDWCEMALLWRRWIVASRWQTSVHSCRYWSVRCLSEGEKTILTVLFVFYRSRRERWLTDPCRCPRSGRTMLNPFSRCFSLRRERMSVRNVRQDWSSKLYCVFSGK